MLRRFIVAMLIVSSLASVSYGKVKDLGDFTVDLPVGWTAQKHKSGLYFIGTTDGNQGIFLGAYELKEGVSLEDLAKEAAKNLHGTKPVYDEKYKGYKFKFNAFAGTDYKFDGVFIDAGNSKCALVFWAKVRQSVLAKILGSIKGK